MLYYDIREEKETEPRLKKKVRCSIGQKSKDKKTYLLCERPMCDVVLTYVLIVNKKKY